jgi:hypothetical protein
MKDAAIERVNSMFTWEQVAFEMRSAYYDVISTSKEVKILAPLQSHRLAQQVISRYMIIQKSKDSRAPITRNNYK